MKLQIFSDLHLDAFTMKPIVVAKNVDVVVVAGDTCQGALRAFESLRRIVPWDIPIVMVMGNREYYHRNLGAECSRALGNCSKFNIYLLENWGAIIGDVRFIGATLWTDYALFGANTVHSALRLADFNMNDHTLISWKTRPRQSLSSEIALELHHQSRRCIDEMLAEPFAGPTVVVTHHAPHRGSLHKSLRSDLLSAAYASDLSELIDRRAPNLWVHGHIHRSFDYQVGRTRIVCNPHGYADENPAFNRSLVVEVPL